MQINVTAGHIIKGERLNCFICPVALAIGETIRQQTCCDYANIQVKLSRCIIGTRSYQLPRVVTRFISDFDNQRTVMPFSFELDLNSPTEQVPPNKSE